MYPGPSGSITNHKKGFCSDGVKQTLGSTQHTQQNRDIPSSNGQSVATYTLPDWPQPEGIFSDGTTFHPIAFLAKVGEVYERVLVKKDSGELMMEHEAFARLLLKRTLTSEDGSVLFKMYDLEASESDKTPEGLIVLRDGDRYLRLDCLSDQD